MSDPRFANPPHPGPFFRHPLFCYSPTSQVAFVFNEGGRGFTLSVYRGPFAVRVYLAGHSWMWGR